MNSDERIIFDYLEASKLLYDASIDCEYDPEGEHESASEIAFRAVIFSLKYNRSVPEWAATATVEAFERYENCQVASLGDAFGIKAIPHHTAKRDEKLMAVIASEVDALMAKGETLKGNKTKEGAFVTVGKKYNFSADKIKQLREKWYRLCKKCGMDQKKLLLQYGNAKKLIFIELADAIAPSNHKFRAKTPTEPKRPKKSTKK